MGSFPVLQSQTVWRGCLWWVISRNTDVMQSWNNRWRITAQRWLKPLCYFITMKAMSLPRIVLLRQCQVSRRRCSSTSHASVGCWAECSGSWKQTIVDDLRQSWKSVILCTCKILEKSSCNGDSINLFRFEDPKLMFIHRNNLLQAVCRGLSHFKTNRSWFAKRRKYHSVYQKKLYAMHSKNGVNWDFFLGCLCWGFLKCFC